MLIATITNKGQITIPKEIRDMLGLQSGDKLEFSYKKGGRLIVRPLKKKLMISTANSFNRKENRFQQTQLTMPFALDCL